MTIESIIMQTFEHSEETEFWSDVYRGRPIAVLNHHGRCYVYLDHILQHNVAFASGDQAVAWLIQRIDRELPARLASTALPDPRPGQLLGHRT